LKQLDDPDLPHKYRVDKDRQEIELCLFYGWDFTTQMLITDTIIPWTIEWLYYYEIWLSTGEWCGGGKHPSPSMDKKTMFRVAQTPV